MKRAVGTFRDYTSEPSYIQSKQQASGERQTPRRKETTMKNIGRYEIYLTGSRKWIWRSVLQDEGRLFVKWYGQMIEVVRGTANYYKTVEKY